MVPTGRAFQSLILGVAVAVALGCSSKTIPKDRGVIPAGEKTQAVYRIKGTENNERRGDVVFIHGLDGNAVDSWKRAGEDGFSWPEKLGEDFPDIGIWSLNYDAASTAWFGDAMPIEDRSKNLIEELRLRHIGERPVVFVTHSLGGIIAKQILRDCLSLNQERWETIGKNTSGVVFLGTPNTGADIAKLANFINRFAVLTKTSVALEQLEKNKSMLRDLNTWYANAAPANEIETLVYYEAKPVPHIGLIVDESSSNPGITNVIPIRIDADHISICKPASEDDQVYLGVAEFIDQQIRPRAVPTDIGYVTFARDFQAAKNDPPKLHGFIGDYANKRVTWKVFLRRVQPHDSSPFVLISEGNETPTSGHILAYFPPSKFADIDASIPVGSQLVIKGTISEKSNSIGVILQDCEVVERVEESTNE